MVHAYYSEAVEGKAEAPTSGQFEHGADVGLRGWGATAEEAFAGAAEALTSLWVSPPASVREDAEAGVGCEAPDLERLLVAFLDELIFLFATRRFLFARLEVRIEAAPGAPLRLSARGRGERFDPLRHEGTVEPKGATLTALRVAPEAGGWVAQCVVDV